MLSGLWAIGSLNASWAFVLTIPLQKPPWQSGIQAVGMLLFVVNICPMTRELDLVPTL